MPASCWDVLSVIEHCPCSAHILCAANKFENSESNFEKDDRRARQFGRKGKDHHFDRPRERDHHYEYYDNSQYSYRFQNLEEVVGQVMQVAQDQNGCRFLQRKFDEGGAAAVAVVFDEIQKSIVELMMDPFGNYLIQKLLDRCSDEQRLEVSLQDCNINAVLSALLGLF